MAKFPLDLKHFAKIKEDGKTSTFKHKEGHEIKIAHAALSPEAQKHIKSIPLLNEETVNKFADGGEVANKKENYQYFKSGGKVASKMVAPAEEPTDQSVSINMPGQPANIPSNFINPDAGAPPTGAVTPAPADNEKAPDIYGVDPQEWQKSKQQYDNSQAATPQLQQPVPYDVPAEASQSQAPQAQESAPVQVPESNATRSLDPATKLQGGMNMEENSLRNEAVARQRQDNAEAAVYHAQAGAQKQFNEDFQNSIKTYSNDFAQYKEAVQNQVIDPNHYMGSLSTGGKINTAIGLILSGIGAGMSHGTNLAAKMLDDNINRDMEAQKANMGKKVTLLHANMEHFKNIEDATNMTRIQMNDYAVSKLQDAAKSTQGAIDLNTVNALVGSKVKENANLMYEMAMKRTLMNASTMRQGMSEDNYTANQNIIKNLGKPDIYHDNQSRYIPGVGVAAGTVKPDDKEAIEKLNTLNKVIDEAHSFQKEMGMSGAWSPQNRAKADVFNTAIVDQMGDLTNLKRLSPNIMESYKKASGEIGSLNTGTVAAKLEALKHQVDNNKQQLIKSLNVTPFNKPVDLETAKAWAAQNPGPKADKILQNIRQMQQGNGQ